RLLAEAEVVIVVGGRGSNNTRQLVLAAEAAGRRAHQIERPDELDPAWLDGAEVVGLTAGTSTLPETVRAVHARLQTVGRDTSPTGP
ncbi:MAG: 4-hydroxy-3-methylbut-2-enyl diphosphate reductase, partial [Gluconacetobacter diazotrophicus]|nr:4-hydroxy-3-methylbut-2-enyl diphosphate reductase [Gluconacetobacter diazotrophicus]